MANVKINSIPSHNYQVVEQITEAKQLERSDSGKYFVWDQGDYDITLPKMATNLAGCNIILTRRTLSDDEFDITTHADDGALIHYIENEGDDSSAGTAITTIRVRKSSVNSHTAKLPCFVKFWTDGTYWYSHLYGVQAGVFSQS